MKAKIYRIGRFSYNKETNLYDLSSEWKFDCFGVVPPQETLPDGRELYCGYFGSELIKMSMPYLLTNSIGTISSN